MDGIKKVSYLPAKRMESSTPSMSYKGRIEIGSDADITIFNPETIIDKSTVKDTGAPSVGVEYVLVNVVIVKNKDGIVKGVKPEKPVMSYFVDKTIHNEPVEFKLKSNDGIDISVDNIYEIDGKTYLPIKEVFEELNILADIFKDGQINIGKILNLTIGSKNANLRNQDIQLKDKLKESFSNTNDKNK